MKISLLTAGINHIFLHKPVPELELFCRGHMFCITQKKELLKLNLTCLCNFGRKGLLKLTNPTS